MFLLYLPQQMPQQMPQQTLHSTMLLLYLDDYFYYNLFVSFTFHYASTISYLAVWIYDFEANFTFHYASTISHGRIRKTNTKWLYIPLCFYYIIVILNRIHKDCYFTFHYASTISWSSMRLAMYTLLYIPLCFYYIPAYWRLAWVSPPPLHSTMLLLYPPQTATSPYRHQLYIPLCFYYIVAAGEGAGHGEELYIPLCFYYIPILRDMST